MISSSLRDIKPALIGFGKLMAYQDGWRDYFDVSTAGVLRSFSAAIWSLPIFILYYFCVNYFLSGLAPVDGEPIATLGLLDGVLTFVRIWVAFPIIAFVTVRILGLEALLGPWLSVHNWTVFILLHFTGFVWLIYAAGLIDENGVLIFNGFFYPVVRLFVHYRVAEGALGCHWTTALAAAGIPLVADWLLIQLI
ncbi:hypothetical protein [Woodsholea maritima]|uniref:hypothetical protein n=1 Tax=Woodsholea maritima TaxID=240237 RepID=UPI00037D7617|nr:hypothetical protein [Woodsholea maritima]